MNNANIIKEKESPESVTRNTNERENTNITERVVPFIRPRIINGTSEKVVALKCGK